MANRSRKRAPALFEVIRETGGPAERRPLFRFPKLSLGRTATTAPGFAVVDAAPAMADLAPAPRLEMPDIRPSLADPTIGRGSMMMSSSASGGPARRRRSSGLQLGYDADRQEVTLRMRYTTAVVGAFSVLVLIGLAYVTGRQGGRAPAALAAVSTETLKKSPAQPGVLDVGRGGGTALASVGGGPATVTAMKQPAAPKTGASSTQQQSQRPQANGGAARPLVQQTSAVVEDNARRAINLNYVIMQSYPDRKSAQEAADFLNKTGIRCTVEPAPAGFVNNPSWVSVIGTTGFQRIRNSQEFDTYIKAIEKAGTQFAGNSKFKRFQPQAYKWRQGA